MPWKGGGGAVHRGGGGPREEVGRGSSKPQGQGAAGFHDSSVRPSAAPSQPSFHLPPLEAGRSRTAYPNPAPPAAGKPTAGASGGGPGGAPPVHSFLQCRWREARKQILFRVFPNFLSRAPVNVGGLAPSLLLQVPRQVALESRQLRLEALHLALRVLRRALLLLGGSSCACQISSFRSSNFFFCLLLLECSCSRRGAPARGGAGRGGGGGHGGLLRPERHPGGGDGAPRGRRRPLARPRRRPCPEGGCSPERPPHRRTAAA